MNSWKLTASNSYYRHSQIDINDYFFKFSSKQRLRLTDYEQKLKETAKLFISIHLSTKDILSFTWE